jgi:hypothetical protein
LRGVSSETDNIHKHLFILHDIWDLEVGHYHFLLST